MTMIVNLSLESFNDIETIPVEVKKLRDLVSNETKSNNNLTVLVGGPGGLFADFIQVFQSIDRLLLIVTIVLVFTILLIIYRSPITAILPLLIVASIFLVAQGIIAFIDQETGDFLKVNGQSTGIMTVVLFGSGTDYFLFISSRFKEELSNTKDKHEAMKKTMQGVGGAVTSAALTIIVASSILLLCILKSYQSLGPVIGIAIFLMLIASITLIPSMLCILGRFSFWPVNLISKNQNKNKGVYTKIAKLVINKPITTLIITGSILLAMFTGLIGAKPTFDQLASLPNNADSVKSFELLRDGFNPGELAPVEVYVDFKSPEAVFKKENLDKIDILTNILASSEGIIRISSPTRPFGIESPLGGAVKIIKYLSSNDASSFNIKSKVYSYTSPDKSISKYELILNENPYDEKGMDLIPGIRNHIKNQGPNSGIDLSTI